MITAIHETLQSGSWLEYCPNLHDVAGVALSAIRIMKLDSSVLDSVISSSSFISKIVMKTRSLETLTSTAGRLKSVGLVNAASAILEPSSLTGSEALLRNLTSARSGEVLGFLKSLSRSKREEFLDSVNVNDWASSRSLVAVDYASTTCQLCRYLESLGYKELAVAPALELIKKINLSYLFRSDLGDISNLIRMASPENSLLEGFFNYLLDTKWLSHAYSETRSGQLCGAIMSFANTIPNNLRDRLLIPEVVSRIEHEVEKMHELLSLTEEDYDLDFWSRISQEKKVPFEVAKNRRVARFVCILGSGYALWGNSFPAIQWVWPQSIAIEDVYFSRSASDSESSMLGMYELQYWLGLKYLTRIGVNMPAITDIRFINGFVKRLEMSPPPTGRGSVLRLSLLDWLTSYPLSKVETFP